MAAAVMAASCGSSSPSVVAGESPPGTEVGGVDEAVEPPTTMELAAPVWTMTELSERGADARVFAAAVGENLVVMSSTEDQLTAWVEAGDGWLPAEIGREPVGERGEVEAMGTVPGGVLAVVNYYQSPGSELWFSAEGSSWAQLAVDGFDRPASASTVTATDSAVFVTGALRAEENTCCDPFTPVIWRSEDLATWTMTELDVRGDIVAAGSGLLAAGEGSGGAVLWRSDDEGRSWASVPAPEVGGGEDRMFHDMAVGKGVIIAVGTTWGSAGGEGLVIVSSTDDGGSWVRQELDPGTAGGLEGRHQVQWAGGAFWIITSRWFDTWDDPDRCYADLASCQAFSESVVLRSEDGFEWAEIDLSALDPPEYFGLDGVVETGDGVVIVGSAENLLVWYWPSPAAPPLRPPPDALEAPEFDLASRDSELEVGTTYRYPLYIHCGMDYLATLNGHYWYLLDAPDGTIETGAGQQPDPSWPVADQTIFGFITLVDENTIEYTIGDGDVIAVYGPSDEPPPMCM